MIWRDSDSVNDTATLR